MTVRITDKTFDFTRTYYLAGPMTGYPDFNYAAFGQIKQDLESAGVQVASPHTLPWPDSHEGDEELWQVMMRSALKLLLDCDGIILMRGWTNSRGALVEYNIAAALRLPSYFLDGKFLIHMHDPERSGK